ERRILARQFAALPIPAPTRITRRLEPASHGQIDRVRTVRDQRRRGGEPGPLRYAQRRRRPRRIVFLIDVSGSMKPYADSLLRLAHYVCSCAPQTEVFAIGTRLTRITPALRCPDVEDALAEAGRLIPDWAGGTRLADNLHEFLRTWGRRGGAAAGGRGRGRAVIRGVRKRSPCDRWQLTERFQMRDVLDDLVEQWRAGGSVGLGTVVAAFSSAPRLPGAAMAVSEEGVVTGSVSGGCVEGAVYETATEVLGSGVPQLQRYGFSDDDAFAVGLTCGGTIDVFVENVNQETFPQLGEVARDIQEGNPVAIATVIEHPDSDWIGRRIVLRPETAEGTVGSDRADHAIIDDARGLLAVGRNATLTYGPDGQRLEDGMRVFVSAFAPRPRMIVFGAI